MRETLAIAILTIKEGLKSKVVQSSFIAIVFLMLLSVLLSALSLDEPVRTFKGFTIFFIKITSMLSMLFLFLYNIYSDRERGTLHIYLSHLKNRSSYLRGKLLGFMILYAGYVFVSLTLASAIAALWKISGFSIFEKLLRNFPHIFLSFALLISISCLLYTLLPSSFLVNLVLCLGIFLAGNLTTDAYLFVLRVKLSLPIKLVSEAVYYLLPNFTLIRESSELTPPIAYSVGYSCAVELLAELIFERSEIT